MPKDQLLESKSSVSESYKSKGQENIGAEMEEKASEADNVFAPLKKVRKASDFVKSLQEKIGSLKIKPRSFPRKELDHKSNYFLSHTFRSGKIIQRTRSFSSNR